MYVKPKQKYPHLYEKVINILSIYSYLSHSLSTITPVSDIHGLALGFH